MSTHLLLSTPASTVSLHSDNLAHPFVQRKAMFTVQFLPSVRDSETAICSRCNTRQYPRNGECIRCHCPLGLEYLFLKSDPQANPRTANTQKQLARSIGVMLRSLRRRRGLTQSQLAVRSAGSVARTYLSKAECGHVMLPLGKLLPIAKALGLSAVILRFETVASHPGHPS